MSTLTCPKCGKVSEDGALVCTKCGTLLFNPSVSTVHMRVDPSLLRLRRTTQQAAGVTLPERTVSLTIRGMSERLNFEEGTEIVLGRSDLSTGNSARLDLSRYGAHERGVSREHVVLRFGDNQLTITDLNSVNGTSVNMNKLKPSEPHVLQSGDELMLGSLSIVIRFELGSEVKKTDEVLRFEDTRPLTRASLAAALSDVPANAAPASPAPPVAPAAPAASVDPVEEIDVTRPSKSSALSPEATRPQRPFPEIKEPETKKEGAAKADETTEPKPPALGATRRLDLPK